MPTGVDVQPSGPVALTARQAVVLTEIVRYYEATLEGAPVCYLARRLAMRNHEAVRGHVAALYRKGWLVSETSPAIPKRPFLAQ